MKKPQKIILFNLDGIFEIFLQLEDPKQQILASSIKDVFEQLDDNSKRKMILLTPKMARNIIGF